MTAPVETYPAASLAASTLPQRGSTRRLIRLGGARPGHKTTYRCEFAGSGGGEQFIYQLQLLPGVAHNDVTGLFQLRRVGRVLAQHEVVAEYRVQRRAQRLQNDGDEFIFAAARGFSHGAGRRFPLIRGDPPLFVELAVGNVAGETAGMNELPAFEERVGVDQDVTD